MKTDLAPTSSDLSLLPRADLPVIWDGFRAKAEELRTTAETLTVTSVEQKSEMELARTTRLTLKQIRVEVEKKRVELGEGHLTEIQKINKAAKAIREAIEPLEARLLHQETYADRVEADRIVELTKRRNDEIRSVSPTTIIGSDLGKMPQDVYDAHMVRLRAEVAELAEAKRKRAEAEAKLAEEQAAQRKLRDEQAQAFLAQQAEAQRQARAAAAEAELKLAEERAERRRQEQELIERLAREQAEKDAVRTAQEAEEKKVRYEKEAVLRGELEAEIAKQKEEQQALQAKMLELEVRLTNERAAKQAEEFRLFKLALAPDVEQLREFNKGLYNVPQPFLKTSQAARVLEQAQGKLAEAMLIIDVFCAE